jgi:hypothetical protein
MVMHDLLTEACSMEQRREKGPNQQDEVSRPDRETGKMLG